MAPMIRALSVGVRLGSAFSNAFIASAVVVSIFFLLHFMNVGEHAFPLPYAENQHSGA
jgi:hypothetical protein